MAVSRPGASPPPEGSLDTAITMGRPTDGATGAVGFAGGSCRSSGGREAPNPAGGLAPPGSPLGGWRGGGATGGQQAATAEPLVEWHAWFSWGTPTKTVRGTGPENCPAPNGRSVAPRRTTRPGAGAGRQRRGRRRTQERPAETYDGGHRAAGAGGPRPPGRSPRRKSRGPPPPDPRPPAPGAAQARRGEAPEWPIKGRYHVSEEGDPRRMLRGAPFAWGDPLTGGARKASARNLGRSEQPPRGVWRRPRRRAARRVAHARPPTPTRPPVTPGEWGPP